MVKVEEISLIRYEFVVYLHVLKSANTYKVCDVSLTEDEFIIISLQSTRINWVQAEKLKVIGIEEIKNGSVMKVKKKICGLFDTEPRNWKYARIKVSDNANTEYCFSKAEMPKSPVIPVVFDVKLGLD